MVKAKKPNVTKGKKRRPVQIGRLSPCERLDQKELRQLDDITVEKRFTDKASGKDMHILQLQLLLEHLRGGDTVVCQEDI